MFCVHLAASMVNNAAAPWTKEESKMKLDIEAMAREAGAVKERDETFGTAYEFELPQLEAFTRLIVERCAQECKGIAASHTGAARRLDGMRATHAVVQRDGANECAAAIRNLLED